MLQIFPVRNPACLFDVMGKQHILSQNTDNPGFGLVTEQQHALLCKIVGGEALGR